MNSSSNATAVLRTLIIYAICVPLAVFIGYLLTDPMNYSSMGIFGVMALLLISPILFRWHYPLLLFSLQLGAVVFFVKGSPSLGLVMTALSLGISLLERTMNPNRHFIRVPEITWPLICMAGVILFTAKMTGGIGLHSMGSDVYGGKKYVLLFIGILLYFALSARRIPPERAKLYVTLYFAGAALSFIGDLYAAAPHWATPIFWFFPPTSFSSAYYGLGATRLGGFSSTGVGLCCLLMARYGIRGILLSGNPLRLFIFVLSILMIFMGGFRGQFFTVGLIFGLLFCMEGLHRSRLLPLFLFMGVLGLTILIPMASKLPFTVQRTIAFLPLHLDRDARQSAQDTVNWRLDMWKALLPQVPPHLLLGKGLAISPEDFQEFMGADAPLAGSASFDASQTPLALSYDYHNGPLSILIPFGIWGAITFLWLIVVGLRALHANYRYGDAALQTVNMFFFASFITAIIAFIFVGGSFETGLGQYTGILGLSIALNGGICRRAPRPAPLSVTTKTSSRLPPLQPAFPR